MSRSTPVVRAPRIGLGRPKGLLAPHNLRSLTARSARPGTPGLIGSGPGFAIPRLETHLCEFSTAARSADAAQFAANLIRAGVAGPEDWAATRDLSKFFHRTLVRFVGDRMSIIDYAFDIALSLSPTVEHYTSHEVEIDPSRVLLSFSVASTVSWVNLTPALELLEKEHPLLPSIFYHSLQRSLSRWFRIFDINEARWSWDSWMESREEEEEARKGQCEREGVAYEPLKEPALPPSIRSQEPRLSQSPAALVRSRKAKRLIEAVEKLRVISQKADCPALEEKDREDLFPDADPAIPLIALAFGEHDAVIEFLNMELEVAGQVEIEPWPILKMDGTDPRSIRQVFGCARVALDTLAVAAEVLALVPGFEPLQTYSPFGV